MTSKETLIPTWVPAYSLSCGMFSRTKSRIRRFYIVMNGELVESFMDCFGYFYANVEYMRASDAMVVQTVVAHVWQHFCEDLRDVDPRQFANLVKWTKQVREMCPPRRIDLGETIRAQLPQTDREVAYAFLAMVLIPGGEDEVHRGKEEEEGEEKLYIDVVDELRVFDQEGNEITADNFDLTKDQLDVDNDLRQSPSTKNQLKNKKRLARRKKKTKTEGSGTAPVATTSAKGKERAIEPDHSSDAKSPRPVPSTPDTVDVQELVNTLAEAFRNQSIHPGSAFAALSSLYSSDPSANAKDPDALRGASVDTARDAKSVSQMYVFLDVLAQGEAEGAAS